MGGPGAARWCWPCYHGERGGRAPRGTHTRQVPLSAASSSVIAAAADLTARRRGAAAGAACGRACRCVRQRECGCLHAARQGYGAGSKLGGQSGRRVTSAAVCHSMHRAAGTAVFATAARWALHRRCCGDSSAPCWAFKHGASLVSGVRPWAAPARHQRRTKRTRGSRPARVSGKALYVPGCAALQLAWVCV